MSFCQSNSGPGMIGPLWMLLKYKLHMPGIRVRDWSGYGSDKAGSKLHGRTIDLQ